MRRPQPTIPEPFENFASLRMTALATKEATEVMLGQRGDVLDRAVTFGDLVKLGLITADQLPNGQNRY